MANILFQWLFTGLVAVFHPFYVSLIEINHNRQEASVEISVRVFAEDLEKTIQQYNKNRIDILHPKDSAFLDGQINTYLQQKIKLTVNGQPVKLQYIGHELQKESIWCFFEVPNINDMSKLQVDCSLLYDLETSQSNIIHVKSKGADKSRKLEYPARMVVFDF